MSAPHSTVHPEARLLANGRYFALITAAGTGQSRRHGHVVNRWLGDPVEDAHGQFIYLRDVGDGKLWSAGLQPVGHRGERYVFSASAGACHLLHEQAGILSQVDVAVSPQFDMEIRRLTLKNLSGRRRTLEVTSYLESVLTWQGADIGHPAFSKLFLQTRYVPEQGALVTERRPRGNDEKWPSLYHALAGANAVGWETDRLRFLGRGRTAAQPAALEGALSGTVGNVLDPCCSLRAVVDLDPGESKVLAFLTGIAETSREVRTVTESHRTAAQWEQVYVAAEEHERSLWSDLKLSAEEAADLQSLAAAMHYGSRALKPAAVDLPADTDVNAVFGQFKIPRDRMQIVVSGGWGKPVTQEVLRARQYWGAKGFFTNLIVLAEDARPAPAGLDDRVFTLNSRELPEPHRRVLLAAASLVVEQRLPVVNSQASPLVPPVVQRQASAEGKVVASTETLQFFNGYGGFSQDGTEYVIRLAQREGRLSRPPLPWINVVANRKAGFLVSEAGAGCTWARNSQANRITPWSNEPVTDPYGEAYYLRDESSGEVWSPLPGPVPSSGDYEVRHGFGRSRFLTQCQDLEHEVTMFVPEEDPLKIVRLRLTNRGGTVRNLSFTSYQRLVLGSLPELPSMVTTRLEADGSLRAVNLAAGDFRGGLVFSDLQVHGAVVVGSAHTADRAAFLGQHGTPVNPAALVSGGRLNSAVGTGLDPCFVQQRVFNLQPGATVECVVLLGEVMNEDEAAILVSQYRALNAVLTAEEEACAFWKSLLGGVQVSSPSPILNVMVNGWLAYQTLCCRMWARSGFYQSSGAFGYRDQLQDSGSLLALDPAYARAQILLHARHQFEEGDVLHWWHAEPIGRGLRTKFSDDLLWLAFLTADYVGTTGDVGILDERAPFLTAPLLGEHQDEVYLTPEISPNDADLYEHCCRTMDRSLKVGEHGLPLMGVGDWNDGMSRVGREGRGESVWMAFFLYHILGLFIPICERRSDSSRVERYTAHRKALYDAINEGGWDGEWYRRAYYDNGQPLGSWLSDECQIDALAQSWAVIAKAAPPERAASAMNALSQRLISESDGIIRLLTPPFVKTANDPGYIKGYVAGVRENGGQYTHAACWVVKAVAEYGENNRALRLLEMLSPVAHARTQEAADLYKTEPYVMAADIYGAEPHVGRGGWTWYTGSSGWMFRVAVESILGLRVENGDTLVIKPCVPDDWTTYSVIWRDSRSDAVYEITIGGEQGSGRKVVQASCDGTVCEVVEGIARIPLQGKEGRFAVKVGMG
ncbi:glycosyl transferase [Verrucomicrobium sp. BvORR106]|uniref:GH36-type glycosyl hydrolase domain-containing protein n=1 Tax=Verrucomicrobium sp. BvORR106 TaxID=1403819 RepID=UPI00056EA036|nr:glycosyl transferase [Verrucomicrobium sp. BvORR106]